MSAFICKKWPILPPTSVWKISPKCLIMIHTQIFFVRFASFLDRVWMIKKYFVCEGYYWCNYLMWFLALRLENFLYFCNSQAMKLTCSLAVMCKLTWLELYRKLLEKKFHKSYDHAGFSNTMPSSFRIAGCKLSELIILYYIIYLDVLIVSILILTDIN